MALPKIVWKKSPNSTPGRNRKIKYIVIHWWDDPKKKPTFAGTVKWLCNPKTEVSAHYVVEARKVYQLVKETDIAWQSSGENHESIGIECNPLQRAGDYKTIAELVANIWKRRGIMPIYPHKKLGNTACPGNYNIGKIHSMALQVLVPPKLAPKPLPITPSPSPTPIFPTEPVVISTQPETAIIEEEPKVVINVEESKRFTLNTKDAKSIAIGALLAIGGSLLAYFSDLLPQIDWGKWAYVAIPLASILINAARKFLEGSK